MFCISKLLDFWRWPKVYTCVHTCITGHQCTYPGCKRVLVLDGNMKNRRDVCMAPDAGYTKYEGLPGAVKTGCMNSPKLGARHCLLHKVRACNPFAGENKDKDAPECLESHDRVVETILEKRTTRTANYYKVRTIILL